MRQMSTLVMGKERGLLRWYSASVLRRPAQAIEILERSQCDIADGTLPGTFIAQICRHNAENERPIGDENDAGIVSNRLKLPRFVGDDYVTG